jgi:hypothetical protein
VLDQIGKTDIAHQHKIENILDQPN